LATMEASTGKGLDAVAGAMGVAMAAAATMEGILAVTVNRAVAMEKATGKLGEEVAQAVALEMAATMAAMAATAATAVVVVE